MLEKLRGATASVTQARENLDGQLEVGLSQGSAIDKGNIVQYDECICTLA